ncbi:PREDICTED: uncharacterized protein LOC105458235 isoform X2 [Wasmannia auropunctata]|uniref:uncharacterized protein LOC105458235 isoform X2 n=1 Tax=Wasmannia auropunctata TaxID=64793 RepID=UPI0005EF7C31|nr:PREDICTED: uncharacterized protein LOC105458235 isoform X2 [Wasmannia auropunctata]
MIRDDHVYGESSGAADEKLAMLTIRQRGFLLLEEGIRLRSTVILTQHSQFRHLLRDLLRIRKHRISSSYQWNHL